MGEFSLTHLLLLGLIILIFFGPSRLPQLGQSLGKAIRGFKSGLSEIDVEAKDIHDTVHAAPKAAPVETQLHNQATQQAQTQSAPAQTETTTTTTKTQS